MTDVYYDDLSLTDAIRRAASEGDQLYGTPDTAAYDLAGVLPARSISARVMAFALSQTATGAELSGLQRVAFARNDAELALARENLRLVKLALLA